jgi:hypothetical protein
MRIEFDMDARSTWPLPASCKMAAETTDPELKLTLSAVSCPNPGGELPASFTTSTHFWTCGATASQVLGGSNLAAKSGHSVSITSRISGVIAEMLSKPSNRARMSCRSRSVRRPAVDPVRLFHSGFSLQCAGLPLCGRIDEPGTLCGARPWLMLQPASHHATITSI